MKKLILLCSLISSNAFAMTAKETEAMMKAIVRGSFAIGCKINLNSLYISKKTKLTPKEYKKMFDECETKAEAFANESVKQN